MDITPASRLVLRWSGDQIFTRDGCVLSRSIIQRHAVRDGTRMIYIAKVQYQDIDADKEYPCGKHHHYPLRIAGTEQKNQRKEIGEPHQPAWHNHRAEPDGAQDNHKHARHPYGVFMDDLVDHGSSSGRQASIGQEFGVLCTEMYKTAEQARGGKDHSQVKNTAAEKQGREEFSTYFENRWPAVHATIADTSVWIIATAGV